MNDAAKIALYEQALMEIMWEGAGPGGTSEASPQRMASRAEKALKRTGALQR